MQKLIYWKEEPEDRKWKPTPDTGPAREKAIKAGAMFMTWCSFSEEPVNGREPVRYGDFPLDFDSSDPGKALQDLKTLCFIHLEELFSLEAYSIQYFCSGGKGFHAVIPAYLFGSQEGDPYLPLIYKKVALEFNEILKSDTMDLSLYAMKKGKMFRLPNIKRRNGFHKVPLTLEEVRDLSIKKIKELSKSPRTVDPVEVDEEKNAALSELYERMKAEVYKELSEKPEPEKLDPEAITKLSKGLPDCLKYILTEMPTNDKCNFNRLTLILITYFLACKTPRSEIWKAAQSFLQGYPHSETYNTQERRLEHFNSQFGYLKDNPDYGFSCGYVKSLGLPGSAFDCSKCIGEKEPEIELTTFGDILDMNIKFPPPVIDGLLETGSSLLLTGESGLGKSLAVVSMALHIAAGKQLFRQFDIPEARGVLLIQSENTTKTTKLRLMGLLEAYEGEEYKRALYRIVTSKVGQDVRLSGDLLDKKFTDKLVEMIEASGAGVLILDPLISYHRANENDNVQMRNVLDALTILSGQTGAGVIVCHHHGKNTEYTGSNKARGATAIKDWARGILTMNKQKHESRLLVKVDHSKHSDFPEAPSFILEIIGPKLVVTEPDTMCPPSRVREILESLGGEIDSQNAFVKEIMNICEVSYGTAYKAVQSCEEFGFISVVNDGRKKRVLLD